MSQHRAPGVLKMAALAAACLALAGCEASTFLPWPDEGRGGLAERRPSTDARIDNLSDQLVVLISRNARYYAAAETADAERLLIQIRRQSEGGFPEDTEIDIARFKQKLAMIERQLPRRAAQSGSR